MKAISTISFIVVLGLAACGPAAPQPQAGEPPVAPASSTESQAATEEPMGGAEGEQEVVIETNDVCEVVSQEEVEAAFGREVVEATPNTQTIGSGCEYAFDTERDAQLQVTFYEGEMGKHYLAGLVAASQESCDAFFEKLFDIAFGENPDSGQDVSTLSFADLYRQYTAIFENCPAYIHSVDRPDVGSNVVATELIVFNWSSSVAVLGDDRIVELTYQEPISAEAEAGFATATDRDSFYAVAQPYADSVLAGYTQILIGLLQGASAQ